MATRAPTHRRSRRLLLTAAVLASVVGALLGGLLYLLVLMQDYRHAQMRARLHTLALAGQAEPIHAALDAGAKVDERTRTGGTLLMSAASGGHTALVKMLLDHGADVNARDAEGLTALMIAAGQPRELVGPGHVATVRLLLARGADPGIRDTGGLTARERARKAGNDRLVEALAAAK